MLQLEAERFLALISDLEGCGTYSMHDSVGRSSIYFAGIDSDKADAFTVLYYWLHSELSEKDNMDAIVTALSEMDMDTFELLAIQLLLIAFQNVPASVSLNLFTILLPIASLVLQIAKILGVINTLSSISGI
ncbi:MAG TPA: hypothetical protein VFC76_09190 [Oscillospiraceae bacterium]|nr:hypothetical protein [Oscillospiraceae bacterium]